MPLGGIVSVSCLEKLCLGCRQKELNVSDEWTESGREFQIVAMLLWCLCDLIDIVVTGNIVQFHMACEFL